MDFFTLDEDAVIEGYVVTGVASYRDALDIFAPLIGRLDIQRDALNPKFYSRLEADIIKGCVMPPITIALIRTDHKAFTQGQEAYDFIRNNINEGFVLDGIQRLSTLVRASNSDEFDESRPLHVSYIIANSRDRLLYRMITLNNGQRSMSARHQIDVLADVFFDFEDVELPLVAEKGKGRAHAPNAFKKADFVKGYVSYLSGSVSIDNQKIIEDKMDELIATRIIESDIPSRKIEFSDVIDLINRFSKESEKLNSWIHVQNNFIGLSVGIRHSLEAFAKADIETVERAIDNFEEAFSSINISKVNLGKVRRECVAKFVENFDEVKNLDEFNLLDKISEWI